MTLYSSSPLACTHDLQEVSLREWRSRVKTWCPQAKDLYKYLRNELPLKCTALREPSGELTYEPVRMEACLERFWGDLETWPTADARAEAIEAVEDIYSLFMPSFPFVAGISVDSIQLQLRKMKKTCPGPDGWNRQELRALPPQAWNDLLATLWWHPEHLSSSILGLFKRVPLRKDPLLPPDPANFRPIDVFSLIVRLLTSCQVAVLRPWLTKVLHRSQYASDKRCLGGGESPEHSSRSHPSRNTRNLGIYCRLLQVIQHPVLRSR